LWKILAVSGGGNEAPLKNSPYPARWPAQYAAIVLPYDAVALAGSFLQKGSVALAVKGALLDGFVLLRP